MDYGQPVNSPNQEPFFTAGVGNASEINNPNEANSISSEDYAAERNPKNLGNAAISSSERIQPLTENPQEIQGEMINDQALGQIISLEMPPETIQQTPEVETQTKTVDFDRAAIKTTKKISKAGYRAIETATSKLGKNGDASSFYNDIRGEGGLVETNLENSYNRKLAA